MGWLGYDRYDAELAAQTARLGGVVSSLAADAPVPTCPEWTVRDLVTHVRRGHEWCAGMIEKRSLTLLPFPDTEAPAEPGEWAAWLTAGARRLADAVRDAGPDTVVWTWQADKTAGFWLRRMTHDELIHCYDAETAAGAPGDAAADLAVDGVSDMLDTAATLSAARLEHPVFGGLQGDGETLRFAAEGASWLVERTPGGRELAGRADPGRGDLAHRRRPRRRGGHGISVGASPRPEPPPRPRAPHDRRRRRTVHALAGAHTLLTEGPG
jgi:uncharacterized protein (TIGR03083 family)